MPAPIDTLRLQVSSGMIIAGRRWRRVSQAAMRGFGISEACASPLLTIGRLGDGIRQVNLAQAMGIEGASLVRLIDQLCRVGLIERGEDGADRRAKTLSLTASGRAQTALIETELARLRQDVLKGVSRADLEAALRVFHAFENPPLAGRS